MKFNEHFDDYDKNSLPQKRAATKLLYFLEKENHNFDSIFEIGCGTGIFTKMYTSKLNIKKLYLNDFFDTRKYLQDVKYFQFIEGDIEKLKIPKVNLILSSSVFQWIENLDALFEKISLSTNKLIFSIFIDGNLIEIKNHFGISLKYKNVDEIKLILKKYFKVIEFTTDTYTLNFEKPILALKHLKDTGVTGISDPKKSIKKIRTFKDKTLTYQVAFFYCKR